MNMEPTPPPPPPNEPVNLAKLAIIFAVTLGVTFGLCTVAVVTGAIGMQKSIGGVVISVSAVIELICLLGLVVVGFWAIVRSIRS
jgi:hypothetical protein